MLTTGGRFELLAQDEEDSDLEIGEESNDFGGVPLPGLPGGYIPAN